MAEKIRVGILGLSHNHIWGNLNDLAASDKGVLVGAAEPISDYFLDHILTGKPITGLCSPEVGLMAQQTLEAGIHSAAEGRTISLPLPAAPLV